MTTLWFYKFKVSRPTQRLQITLLELLSERLGSHNFTSDKKKKKKFRHVTDGSVKHCLELNQKAVK